ncbi:Asp-tRNA(Asn)/Glu-tRNA(Gln) amidotransferase subunit GatC [bacterium]|jgi:aspartyl-tRNA(Asn)/glutamyl-tRNA(Gln) amidotransferase subunit C|nr:Asp-tRNA(Asn)/Glu-tRNA(Gln) amidotransferase subunit GatC [bacterium]MBT4649327.1 Asp-tRNA(Asn)/Glu-tRNA(Gln) amidotransferase subunit GatC [bacterium]
MSISKEEILKIANLAKLRLTQAEAVKFEDQLSDILEYVDQIQKIDLNNVEPSISGAEDIIHPLREDKVKDSVPETIKQSYKLKDNYLLAPGVFKK